MRSLPSESIDLIYIDPPFFTQRKHKGEAGEFSDKWSSKDEYLKFMCVRLMEMHRLLKKTGSIYVHLDQHVSHYVKVMMDSIFGEKNFRNEIIWKRTHISGRGPSSNLKRKISVLTDSILFYSKTEKTKIERIFKEIKVALIKNNHPKGYKFDCLNNKFFRTAPPGDYTEDSIKKIKEKNRLYITKNGKKRIKYFANEIIERGERLLIEKREIGNIWEDIIPRMGINPKEPLNYPTQKPEKLLERIITASSNPGHLVADFFCGSGTTLAVAKKLGRQYIGCDASPKAIEITKKRLNDIQEAINA